MTKDLSNQSDEFRDQKNLVDAAWQQMEKVRISSTIEEAKSRNRTRINLLSAAASDAIPGYRVVREIHRGGQGVVYEAVQESTQRTIAIKVMREGPFAGAAERGRFEREVQILAQLRHPNIVTIHDSGIHGAAAYFVMDYIAGAQLDRYVARNQPTLKERLTLFALICDAVNAAHLYGIIHRDLKPGNVRVDSAGEPHVLDFGLAKHFTGEDQKISTLTMTGQFVGSLPWASPEQAEGRINQIDVRTDVYALGVMLYQLLTGTFPYKISSSLRETTESIVRSEPVNPRVHNRDLDDDVSTIVLKCLRKAREHRYQSAGELARDIRRYLAGEAIEAKRDSLVYILRKQLSRHKVTAGVMVSFFFVILVGLATSLTFWRQAVEERDHAQAAERLAGRRLAEATAARDAELKSRAKAERSTEKAERINDFLQSILTSVDPALAQGRDTSILDALLAEAASRVERELNEQPEVQAAVRVAIGSTYYRLGQHDLAEPHLRTALDIYRNNPESSPVEMANALNRLALVHKARGAYEEGEVLYREALAQVDTFAGEDDLLHIELLNNLGQLLHRAGKHSEAKSIFQEALPMAEAPAEEVRQIRAVLTNNLALLLQDVGDLEAAERLYQEVIALRRSFQKGPHPETATCLDNLGMLYAETGRAKQAEESLLKALAVRRKVLPPDHPMLAFSFNNLANYYHDRRLYEQAEEHYRGALDVLTRQYGEEHPHIAATISNLAYLMRDRGDLAGSEPLFRQALEMRRRLLGDEHPAVAQGVNNLASLLIAQENFEAAEALTIDALRRYREIWGTDNLRTATAMVTRAALLRKTDRLDESEKLYREALAIRIGALGVSHPHVLGIRVELAHVLREIGDLIKAEKLYLDTQALIEDSLPPEHPLEATLLMGLAKTMILQDRYEDAEATVRIALEIRASGSLRDHWHRFESMSVLGDCLMELGRLKEAESLLLDGYERLAESQGVTRDSRIAAIKRVAHFYELSGDPTSAATWRLKIEDGEKIRPEDSDGSPKINTSP